jgi:pimeloyl-ACP methyl ester carboxylesterase
VTSASTWRSWGIAAAVLFFSAIAAPAQAPKPSGKLVQLDGHHIHIHCTGRGQPTVVIENGFDEFSFDWVKVQTGVEKFTRVCTYDRAGYAWSDPGPLPRTYAQINLDLRSALQKLGEKAPYLFIGHSFGGPVIRNYALTYRSEVAGLIFAESVGDAHRIVMGPKTARIADFAKNQPIPAPHAKMMASDTPPAKPVSDGRPEPRIDPPFDQLSPDLQKAQLWALAQPALQNAENSEREWSPEYLAKWLATDQKGSLGDLPIIVLSREKGGYDEGHDLSADELEKQRRQEHADLAALSSRGELSFVNSGHEIELDAPEVVIQATHRMVTDWRKSH